MILRSPTVNLSPRSEKVLEKILEWFVLYPLAVSVMVVGSPIIAFCLLIKAKRIWRGPDDDWRKCFAWHPVPIPVGRGHRNEWRWLETLEYRCTSVMHDVKYRLIESDADA